MKSQSNELLVSGHHEALAPENDYSSIPGHLAMVGRDQPSGTIMVSECMVGNGRERNAERFVFQGQRQI